jgi:hypothetical protein
MKGYVELLEAAGFKKGRVDTYTRADAVYYKWLAAYSEDDNA